MAIPASYFALAMVQTLAISLPASRNCPLPFRALLFLCTGLFFTRIGLGLVGAFGAVLDCVSIGGGYFEPEEEMETLSLDVVILAVVVAQKLRKQDVHSTMLNPSSNCILQS